MTTGLDTLIPALRGVVAALAIGCLAAGAVQADPGPGFELEVLVARLTTERGKIDKGAERLHAELKHQFRYEGIRVLETRRVKLVVDQVWDLNLPTRRRLRIRPLVVEATGALISIEISGLVQTDLRIRKGQMVIIGAEKFRDGKLVIALQAGR
ncbi:MAG: hypothetical protein IH881_01600 [Myxococcales bacterium]|nr:hypothetical protein [Myxococcales bacterium]